MRITSQQAQLITQSVHHHFGENAKLWLFGSRLDDNKRGGDIDLYVEADPHPLMNEIRCKVQLKESLDLPVDLIVRTWNHDDPIASLAKSKGVLL